MSSRNKVQGHFFECRPDVVFIQNPTGIRGRRRYQTAIKPPDQNFFDMMFKRDAYFWICAKKDLPSQSKLAKDMQAAYESIKKLSIFQKTPICTTLQQCQYWVKQFPCQIVMDEDIFEQAFQGLKNYQNSAQFHIVSPYNLQIAKMSRQNRKIKRIYDNYDHILKIVKQNMQRLAIINNQKKIKDQKQQQRLLRNAIFPNFIKLSKHDKAELLQYRLNLYGLRSLTEQDRYASKDKFIEFSLQKFPHDSQLIDQYKHAPLNEKQILNFYTLDSFFYRTINNTLRIAKQTQQFFTIGQPFNKVFDAIKKQYTPKNVIVYRGADLTASQCEYLTSNVGKYIQINGFISTSMNEDTARQFAKDRNNNKVIQIHLKPVPQKYKMYDYGYVDLQQKHISAFDEQQILINALNIFKVAGKKQKNGFEYYILEYGTIFQILDKDPNKLQQNDKYAYYSFKQLKEMNDQVDDIGQVYIRSHQPEKAVQIYQFKLAKLSQRVQSSVFDEEKSSITLKAADAYLANSEPQKALEYYQILLKQTKNKKILKRALSNFLPSNAESLTADDKQEAAVNLSVAQIKTNIDKYQQAQKQIMDASQLVQKEIEKKFSLDLFMSNIELLWQNVLNKEKQELYQQAHDLLKDIQSKLGKVTHEHKKILSPFQRKKVLFKRTVVYEKMAKISQYLQKQKSTISTIDSSFKQTCTQLSDYIQKNSYEEGILNIRQVQIQRRNKKNFDTEKGLKQIQKSLKIVKSNTIQTDEQITKTYNQIGDIKKKTISKTANIEAKYYYQKQLMIQSVCFGEEDPRTANTKIDIANCQRQDKNVYQALDIFHEAYHTKIYKKNDKHSVHAKILFNMGQAYTDKGDDGLAMKSYDQAFKILQKRLSKKDFQNSILRYKIILKIGRLYLNSSVKDLVKAQQNLKIFHKFIIEFYKYDHSDVALSYNNLGVLYLHKKVFKDAKQNFSKSVDIYQNTQGKFSLDAAKIKSNLALCFAQLKDQVKAIKILLEAQQIFLKIYTNASKANPFASQTKYCQGQINRITRQYEKAIQSYKQSILQEKNYRQNKRQFKKQFKSTIYMSEFVGSQIIPHQPTSYANFQNQESEHSFNCRFKIILCYIKMKKFNKAKVQLLQLKKNIAQRVRLEAKLGRDSLQSKKRVLLKKIDIILTEMGVKQQNMTMKNQIININQQKNDTKQTINNKNLKLQKIQQDQQKPLDLTEKMVREIDD